MTLLQTRISIDAGAPLARRNPVAKLAAAFVPAVMLLVTVDVVTAGVVLAAAVASVPAWGIGWRALFRRAWPLSVAVVTVAAGNAVFTGTKSGTALIDVGALLVTTDSVGVGLAAGLRVAGIALPGVLAVLTIDPVDLADSLARQLRVPARFAYGSLAALRLAPVMAAEWEILGRARRARGFGGDRNPVTAVRVFGGRVFALLVGAVRRGTRLAVAMDARGFDAVHTRTSARQARFGRADAALLAGSALLTAAAVVLAVAAGTWNPILS
ncbi:energy-coupling factor transporter transmembrane component T family protein [Haloactinopolyspora alba]|nr:energy-coupling factor transporter transmembrane component T [Haloactinopolyspora alba]